MDEHAQHLLDFLDEVGDQSVDNDGSAVEREAIKDDASSVKREGSHYRPGKIVQNNAC